MAAVYNRIMKKLIRYKFIGILLLFLTAGSATAQTISISIPDSIVDAGDEISLPISADEILEADNILSGEWEFTTSTDLISFQGVTTTGTLLEGKNTSFNSTSGNFAFASTEPISGSGTIVYLNFTVKEDAEKFDETDLSITSALFNEGDPSVDVENGTVSVRGIELTPKKPSSPLIEGENFQFSLSGNITPPVTWSSSDTDIAVVDSEGLVDGVSPGTVKIFVEDAGGLADSTDFFRVEPVALEELALTVSDRSVTQTLVDSVQVSISDISDLDITSGQVELNYNSSKLEFLSVSTSGTILDGRQSPKVFQDGNTVSVAFADSEPYTGSGPLFNIRFRVDGDATGTADFNPQSALFNEDYEANTSSGTVTILEAPEIVVEQPNDELTIGDSQIYSVQTGGTEPYTWYVDNESIASIDEETGELTAHSRGTVNIVAVDSENFESEPVELTVNDVTVSVPDTTVSEIVTFSLPIHTTDVSERGIISFEIDLDYDENLLNFESVESAGTLSEDFSISNSVEEGILKIAGANSTPLIGDGELLNVNFSVVDTVSNGSSGVVDPVRVQFNEPGENTPTATKRSGIITFDSTGESEQTVDADSSTVTATTPHLADGEDRSTVTVQLADSLGEPIDRFNPEDLLIDVTGDAQYTAPDVTGNPGEYVFSVSNTVAETVSVSITVDDVLLTDQPEIKFEETVPSVNADSSDVTATSPHFADGVDASTVSITIADSLGEAIGRFIPDDITLEFDGSAELQSVVETDNTGEFLASVISTEPGTVGIIVTVDDVQLTDQPEILFEEPVQLVDADSSTVTATSPHLADGEDRSTVIVQLTDTLGEPIDRFNPEDLLIDVTGDAQYTAPDVTENPGEYVFSVTNTVAETVSVSITVDDVQLTDQPEIVFEEPIQIVDADSSTVTATSPHLADGEDRSTVIVQLTDSLGDPIDRFNPEDLLIDVSGDAEFTAPDVTGNPGEYVFSVTNTVAETVSVSITVDDVLLTDQPEIEFEEPVQLVDADSSTVTATSPHLADGEDQSFVLVQLADSLGEPIDRFAPGDLSVSVSGSAEATGPDNTGNPGEFGFTVNNTEAETVTVSITIDDVLLTDQPEIVFEEETGIPEAPEFVSIEPTEDGNQLTWTVNTSDYINSFRIYRGTSKENLEVIDEVDSGSRTAIDQNVLSGTSYYLVTAVNRNGEESEPSNIKSYINTDFVASTEWQLVSVPVYNGTKEMELATIYNFTDRYELRSSLESGKGYWVKSRSYNDEMMAIAGEGVDSLSIDLNRGWNLVGSLSEETDIRLIDDPDNILTETPLYVYRDGSYREVSSLIPGAGHWIYASKEGTISIAVQNETTQRAGLELADQSVSDQSILPALRFRNEQRQAAIYVSQIYLNKLEQTAYYLPPTSPEPKLDIRTRDHTKLINNQPTDLIISTDHYPVLISLDELDEFDQLAVRIHAEKEGKKRSFDLLPGQSDQIVEPYDRIYAEVVQPDEVVSNNQLMPNYPNPFNPTTTIQYQLREQTQVKVEVYDVIGRRVKLLANEVQLSGEHSVEFDGRNMSSGLYFIRFTAGDVVDIRKMTLVK